MKNTIKGLFVLGLVAGTLVGGTTANAAPTSTAPGENGNNVSTNKEGSYDNYPPEIIYSVIMNDAVADGSRQGENGTQAGTIGKNDFAWSFVSVLSENSTTPVLTSGDKVNYSAYYASYGWLTGTQITDTVGKTAASIKPMEKIKLSLTGNIAKYFDVEYSVHSRGIGWQTARNGQEVGTNGVPIEAIKAKLVRNNTTITTPTTPAPTTPVQPEQPSQPGTSQPENTSKVTLYRLYNPSSTEHLYTKDTNEYKVLAQRGWKQEGEAWKTATTGTEVHRLYNRTSGEHFYTKDTNEKNVLVQRGWKYEGIAFYSDDTNKEVPVYRLYNKNAPAVGSHHYTKDLNEKNVLVSRGWKYEGIAFYGVN